MSLLDTDGLSTRMRRQTDLIVIAWRGAQPPESIGTTANAVFEIGFDTRSDLPAPGPAPSAATVLATVAGW